jgi:hypothetical protein
VFSRDYSMILESEPNVEELMDELLADPEKLDWSMGPTSLDIYFNPYAVASYAAGQQIVHIRYEDYPDLFGEGYGAKIQKGGNYIKDDVNFILFDVLVNGKWWLKRSALEQIAKDLNIEIVPLIGYMTIPEAIEYVKKGFKSTIAENKEYNAEGLVLKPTCGLLDRSGKRIITKIKTCDFQKFAAKYGADYTGEQPVNNKYKV